MPPTCGRSTWGRPRRIPQSGGIFPPDLPYREPPAAPGGSGAPSHGGGGDLVVQLQTNLAAARPTMLALYHLFSGREHGELPGIDVVMKEAGRTTLPPVRRVVLVGNKISPGSPSVKEDGTVVRTLWGELAWQLGGRQAFERVRQDDERGTSPGDTLRELFNQYSPCLILIDEWVAYARQLHDQSDLPGERDPVQFCPGADRVGCWPPVPAGHQFASFRHLRLPIPGPMMPRWGQRGKP